jgi:hypothetical protein
VLPGDYNSSGVVDAADFVLWRKTVGTTGLQPYSGADGSGNGSVGPEDYGVWRTHFGDVPVPAPALPGDYNSSGAVDAADYVLWRKSVGATGLQPYSGADGSGNGSIGAEDYGVWRMHFGQVLPPASGQNASTTEQLANPAMPSSFETSTTVAAGSYSAISISPEIAAAPEFGVDQGRMVGLTKRVSARSQTLSMTTSNRRAFDDAILAWAASLETTMHHDADFGEDLLSTTPQTAAETTKLLDVLDATFALLAV